MVKSKVHIAQYVAGCIVWASVACAMNDSDNGSMLAIAPVLLGGIISGASSAAGGILGGIKSLFEKRKLEERRNALAAINRGIQGRELSQTGLAAIRRAEENADEAQRKYNTQAIKGGATDEARIANDARIDDYMANVTSAAYASEQRSKDSARDYYAALDQQIMQRQAENAATGGQTLANAVASAGNVLGSAVADGGEKKKSASEPASEPVSIGASTKDKNSMFKRKSLRELLYG